jgi:RNA polymerase sigma-70 factor (ECF subfamily)
MGEVLVWAASDAGIEAAAEVSACADRYASIFRSHYERVVRWLTVLGVQGGDADDVAQEVFIVAHRKLDQLRPDASVTAWLLAICRRVSATQRRGRARARAREQHVTPPSELPTPEAATMRSEAARMLHEFLVALPEEQRLVFVLYEMDGANANEIAEAVGVSRNTVHSRVRLIREKLARFVGRERAKEKRSDG